MGTSGTHASEVNRQSCTHNSFFFRIKLLILGLRLKNKCVPLQREWGCAKSVQVLGSIIAALAEIPVFLFYCLQKQIKMGFSGLG